MPSKNFRYLFILPTVVAKFKIFFLCQIYHFFAFGYNGDRQGEPCWVIFHVHLLIIFKN